MKIEDILIKPDEDLLDPKDDAVFKFLFTSENEYSRGALKSLISELTGHEVKELRISELKKYDRLEKTTKNMDGKERWGAYLKWIKNKEKIDLVNELIQEEEGLAMATRALRELTQDEEIQFQLITAQKIRMDRYNDIACARDEGIQLGEAESRTAK